MTRTHTRYLFIFSILALMISLVPFSQTVSASTSIFINEIHYDNSGTDTGEAVEIAGPAGTDLTGWSLVLYNGSNGTVYDTTAFAGTITDQGGGFGVVVANYPSNGLQNGSPDGVALVNSVGNVIQFLSYEGTFVAMGGPADGMTSVDIGVAESSGTAIGESLQLTGSGTTYSDFSWTGPSADTFGAINTGQSFSSGPADPKINEFVFNHTGSDTEAFIEVFGSSSTDYSTFTVLEIEGDSSGAGTIDAVLPVSSTDASGFWTDPEDAENGTVTLLLVEGFSGSAGNDIDTDNDGILDSTPWTRIVDDVAVSDGGSSDHTYAGTVLNVGFDGVIFTVGGASRIPNGTDTDTTGDWVRNDFDGFGFPGFVGSQQIGEAINTPGAMNQVITVIVDPFGACGDPATLIHDIQGSGLASTDVGNVRAVEAVVVATFYGPSQIGSYFIQEEDTDADSNPLTSEGLRVFDTTNTPSVGDVIRIRGSVTEFFNLTELNNVTDFAACGSGVATAAEVSLPISSIDALEAYEGMLVTFPQTLYIAEYFNFDRFGEIVLSTERQFQPTAVYEPGSPEAAQLLDENLRSRIKLDDGRGNQNPDPALHPNGSIFDLDNLFRGGDTLDNVTGVLDYNFGEYKVQLTQGANYTNANPRTAAPDDVGGNVKVASFNVLNYFTTLDNSGPICGPVGDQDCRGADNANEFTRQRDKIIAAISAINADVVGLMEIENHPLDVPTEDLVSGLNVAMGPGTYDYIPTGATGSDAIRLALIYKPATVTPVGSSAILDDAAFVNPFGHPFDRNRPAVAQTFMDNNTGGIFTIVVNHLKSKSGSELDDSGAICVDSDPSNDIPDCDQGDGQAYFNATRTAAAQKLIDWLATDPTGSGDEDFLIIGDLNSYDKEDPIDAILAGADDLLGTGDDYTDLPFDLLGEYAYSYVFDGQLGYLDSALANEDLMDEVTGVTIWHINADEADLIDYDTSFKKDAQDAIYASDAYRSSDHDPVIVGLDICDEIAPTFDVLSVTPDTLWPADHKYVDVEATVLVIDNFDPNPTITLVSVESNEPDNGEDDGNTVNDIVIVDDFHFQLRAERSGVGSGRIYTITYMVTDACGNSTTATATVSVPLSQGN